MESRDESGADVMAPEEDVFFRCEYGAAGGFEVQFLAVS